MHNWFMVLTTRSNKLLHFYYILLLFADFRSIFKSLSAVEVESQRRGTRCRLRALYFASLPIPPNLKPIVAVMSLFWVKILPLLEGFPLNSKYARNIYKGNNYWCWRYCEVLAIGLTLGGKESKVYFLESMDSVLCLFYGFFMHSISFVTRIIHEWLLWIK